MSSIITIDLGTPNAGNGDPLRDGGASINLNFANLNTDKLERGGYAGTAQDLKNEIDAGGSGVMTKVVYDPQNKQQDVYDGLYTDIDNTTFDVLTADNAQALFSETDIALLNDRQTGVRFGYLTLNGDLGTATSFNTTEIRGEILNLSDPENPVYTPFTTPIKSNVTPPSEGLNYYYVDPSTPTILSSTTVLPTETQRRTRAYIFRVLVNGGVILGFDSERTLIQNNSNALRQLFEAIGDGKRSGLEVANTAAADLSFLTTSGVALGYDLSPTNYNDPHEKTIAEFNTNTGDEYRIIKIDGVDATLRTQVLVNNYQDGAGALLTVPNNKYSVWYVTTIFATGVKYLIPDTATYTSAQNAIDSLTTDKLAALSAASITETFCNGAIVTKKGVTDFLTGDVTFVSTNDRGGFGSGSGAQAATIGSYLQVANNLSDLADAAAARTNLDLDNNYVTLSTAQTIAGEKTFNADIYFTGERYIYFEDGQYLEISDINGDNYIAISNDLVDVNGKAFSIFSTTSVNGVYTGGAANDPLVIDGRENNVIFDLGTNGNRVTPNIGDVLVCTNANGTVEWQTPSGGSFDPSANQTITGLWNFTNDLGVASISNATENNFLINGNASLKFKELTVASVPAIGVEVGVGNRKSLVFSAAGGQRLERTYFSVEQGVVLKNGNIFTFSAPRELLDVGGLVIANGYKSTAVTATGVTGTYNLNYDTADTYDLTLTGATTLTETNAPATNTSQTLFIFATGGDITLPTTGTNFVTGTYDGAENNWIVIKYFNTKRVITITQSV